MKKSEFQTLTSKIKLTIIKKPRNLVKKFQGNLENFLHFWILLLLFIIIINLL